MRELKGLNNSIDNILNQFKIKTAQYAAPQPQQQDMSTNPAQQTQQYNQQAPVQQMLTPGEMLMQAIQQVIEGANIVVQILNANPQLINQVQNAPQQQGYQQTMPMETQMVNQQAQIPSQPATNYSEQQQPVV